MKTSPITAERISVVSLRPFAAVLNAIDSVVGHPDIGVFQREITSAATFAHVETIVRKAIGSSGFMEFTRFNLGQIMQKERPGQAPQMMRLVIGNPLIMKQMAEHVPDAGSYAPVTILIDERADGVHLSYDRMASLLATHGSPQALKVARDLDAKVEALLAAAAGPR